MTVTEFTGNTITITGLGSMKGSAGVYILSSLDPDNYEASVASGFADIIDGSIKADLKVFAGFGGSTPWEGSGEYYIKIEGAYDSYVYTNGAAINMTNIDSNPKYDFQTKETTIEFSKFAVIPLGEGGYTITISGLSSYNNAMAVVELYSKTMFGANSVATGHAIVSGGSVTVTLAKVADKLAGWTDSGNFFIRLTIDQPTETVTKLFVYTDSKTLTELNVTNWNSFHNSAPQFDFTTGTTFSVGFDKFVSGDNISWF